MKIDNHEWIIRDDEAKCNLIISLQSIKSQQPIHIIFGQP